MPVFEYKALRSDGAITEGHFEADGRQHAFRMIEAMGLRPISLVEQPVAPSSQGCFVEGKPDISLLAGGTTPAPTPPVKRPYLRILMIAFVPCFLWPPLTICLQKLLDFSNTTVWILSLLPIGLTSWLLSRGRLFSSKHRATRALVLPVALAFLWFAFLVWVLLILLLIRFTGSGVPLPI